MAKSFDKRPIDWLRSEPTKRFIDELIKVRNLHFDHLIITQQGGANPGTWMHEDVAIEFARRHELSKAIFPALPENEYKRNFAQR